MRTPLPAPPSTFPSATSTHSNLTGHGRDCPVPRLLWDELCFLADLPRHPPLYHLRPDKEQPLLDHLLQSAHITGIFSPLFNPDRFLGNRRPSGYAELPLHATDQESIPGTILGTSTGILVPGSMSLVVTATTSGLLPSAIITSTTGCLSDVLVLL